MSSTSQLHTSCPCGSTSWTSQSVIVEFGPGARRQDARACSPRDTKRAGRAAPPLLARGETRSLRVDRIVAGLLPLIALGVRRGLARRTAMTDGGPETRYAWSGELHVAYQVLGDGPLDLVISPGWISHAERQGEQPLLAHYLRRPSPYARTLVFDKGHGFIGPGQRVPPLKESMDDIRAVMDVAGSQRAAVVGTGVDPDRRTPPQRWGATLPGEETLCGASESRAVSAGVPC